MNDTNSSLKWTPLVHPSKKLHRLTFAPHAWRTLLPSLGLAGTPPPTPALFRLGLLLHGWDIYTPYLFWLDLCILQKAAFSFLVGMLAFLTFSWIDNCIWGFIIAVRNANSFLDWHNDARELGGEDRALSPHVWVEVAHTFSLMKESFPHV